MLLRLALSLSLIAFLAAAPVARGQTGPWTEGELEYTLATSCTSIIFPPARLVLTTAAGAAFEGTPQRIPHAGEVFYVRLTAAIVGDPCGGGGAVLPEFVPPAGVETAVDRRHPVRWTYSFDDQPADEFTGNVVLSKGPFGGLLVAAREADGSGVPWPLANSGDPLQIKVPVRSARRLTGIASSTPNCPARSEGYGACPRDEAGDHMQIAVSVADGGSPSTLVPIIGLFAREPAKPTLKLAKTVGRRFTATVTTAAGATVTGTLKARGRVVARAKRQARASGVARLRFSIPAGVTAKAQLTVRAKSVDGALSPAVKRRVRLRS